MFNKKFPLPDSLWYLFWMNVVFISYSYKSDVIYILETVYLALLHNCLNHKNYCTIFTISFEFSSNFLTFSGMIRSSKMVTNLSNKIQYQQKKTSNSDAHQNIWKLEQKKNGFCFKEKFHLSSFTSLH